MFFLRQKFSNWMRSVSWRIIVLQHPIIRKVPSDSLDPFSKLLQDIFVEGVINCLSWSYKFFVHNATAVEKNNNHGFHPGSAHACFLRTRRTFRVPFLTLPFGLRIVVKHAWFISSYYFMQIIWLNFKSSQQILTNFQPVRFLLHRQVDSWLCVWVEGCCSSNISQPEHIVGCPAPDLRQPATKASHTIDSNNTHTVLSSWWWAEKCLKHVEQIISVINHSVASGWFCFSMHMQRCMVEHTSNSLRSFSVLSLRLLILQYI